LELPRYVQSEDAFAGVRLQLKFFPCPSCNRVGCLILHGFLYGYQNKDGGIRGKRVFCSNRNLRTGCGRSFSIIFSSIIKQITITAESVWNFIRLIDIGKGKTIVHAFRQVLQDICSHRTAYRLRKRFIRGQSSIRSFLNRIIPHPPLNSGDPSRQTIAHLEAAFPTASNPIAAFQTFFQHAFM